MQVELFLLVVSLLFFASIFTDKLSSKFGVPALLMFLAVGMLFGEDGLGITFNNMQLAQAIATVSLCIILFAGGLDTRFADIKPVMKEGISLASVGVLLTCGISGVIIYYILRWTHASEEVSLMTAFLMAATMSSTDAASVFSILRTQGISLKHNLRPMLELESGSNDPMAYILTITLIGIITQTSTSAWWLIIFKVIWQITAGLGAGFGFGKFIVWMMRKVKISNDSLYPILILTACIFIFAATYFVGGNSYLAVYIGGLVIGNSKFAHKRSSLNFFDGMSWLCQLTMFLVLGLLVTPHSLANVIVPGLIVSAVMIFISRPLSVFLTMMPFKYTTGRDKLFLSWCGLKGAVPIIFAILCMASNVPHADMLFNIAFFCTLVSLILQGSTLSFVAKHLDLVLPNAPHQDPTHFDIDLPEEVREQTIEVKVTTDMLNGEKTKLQDLSLPVNSLVMLLKRGDQYLVPKGATDVLEGDWLLIVSETKSAIVRAADQTLWELELIEHTGDFLRKKINHK